MTRASRRIARPAVPMGSVQGSLALDLGPRVDPPEVSVPTGRSADTVQVDLRTRRRAEQWVQRYAQAAVEIVAGDRPATQLLRWTSPRVYADLQRRAHLVALATGRDLREGRARRHEARPQVLSIRLCFVRADAVEASVHVRHGQRSRALAARFELRQERWLCTAAEFA